MRQMWQSVILLLPCMALQGIVGSIGLDGRCQPKSTCTDCLRSPGCAWCKQKGFLAPEESNDRRCDREEVLRRRHCADGEVLNPQPAVWSREDGSLGITSLLQDESLGTMSQLQDESLGNMSQLQDESLGTMSQLQDESLGTMSQLQPQKVHLKLRLGVPQSFEVQFQRAQGFPIDLYYLMDMSFSMKDDLVNVKNLGRKVVTAMKNITSAVRIGFGSFVDKRVDPYVNTHPDKLARPCPLSHKDPCQPTFSFRHVLQLTEDVEEFERSVSQQNISSNLDNPESGLDAIMQVAVCQNEIGWGNGYRILVYTSDDTFHLAGDGKLAGLIQPNDGRCHLNGDGIYDEHILYDYPSVGHISEVLSANNIKLIFAVTDEHIENYEALSELLPQSVVGLLEHDSRNVVQLISEAYNNLLSSIRLEHHRVPLGLRVSYTSHCGDGQDRPAQGPAWGECGHVEINQQVNFTVTVTSSKCFTRKESFVIKVQGISEELRVTVETLCDCDCQDTEKQSPQCNGNGTFQCGICSCNSGHLGQRCECETPPEMDTSLAQEAGCSDPQKKDTRLCSGQGTCVCGHCLCLGSRRGQYCQCDDTDCDRHNNLLCGGNGKCDCGSCECFHNYTGSVCECSTLTNQCQTINYGICSHHGQCECNECKCHPGFYGKHCNIPQAPCHTYRGCAACMLLHETDMKRCRHTCGTAKPFRINGTESLLCQSETVLFNVEVNKSTGEIVLYYTNNPRGIDQWIIHAGIIMEATVLLGVIVIIIYRLKLEVSYQWEFRQFLKEKENICREEIKTRQLLEAITTITSPMYVLESDSTTSTFGKTKAM